MVELVSRIRDAHSANAGIMMRRYGLVNTKEACDLAFPFGCTPRLANSILLYVPGVIATVIDHDNSLPRGPAVTSRITSMGSSDKTKQEKGLPSSNQRPSPAAKLGVMGGMSRYASLGWRVSEPVAV